MRHAFTLIEALMVLAIAGILLALTAPSLGTLRDRASVRGATMEILAVLATARRAALERGQSVAAHVSAENGTIQLIAGVDTLAVRRLADDYGVSLDASRDSIAYGPQGRGYGAANTRLIIARGSVRDTVFVARTGRVRH
jgi:prepilin-type N-terminal cleavage/methylation domain-containing protein